MDERVTVKRTVRWKDPTTGKSRHLTKNFFQTLNQWNKTVQGDVKDKSQIYAELSVKADQWERATKTKLDAKRTRKIDGWMD